MKLGKCFVTNFAAYKELMFDFSGVGLSLISGPTGVGKSTIMDATAWIIYGMSSKDSAADDMRSWFADDITHGAIEIGLADTTITIHRKRGKASDNDLFWYEYDTGSKEYRGKDLKDTQKLLEERLGVTAELFMIGSYIHQFSNADTFFIAKAKDRREVLEKLADLALPIKLSGRTSDCRKEKKKELEAVVQEKAKVEGMLLQTNKSHGDLVCRLERYEIEKDRKVIELEDKAENFETERQDGIHKMVSKVEALSKMIVDPTHIEGRLEQVKTQIKSLEQAKKDFMAASKKLTQLETEYKAANKECERLEALEKDGACPTCSSPLVGNNHFSGMYAEINFQRDTLTADLSRHRVLYKLLESAVSVEKSIHESYDKCRDDKASNDALIKEITDFKTKIAVDKAKPNHYLGMLETLKAEVNPYDAQLQAVCSTIDELRDKLEVSTQDINETEHLIASLTWLYDKSFELRANMLERAKNELADKTNAYLEKYFDADLRIKLTFEGSDKLNVDITKDGYNCPYKQLSGGERCMLKLAFNLCLMKRAEDVAGVKFNTVMLDEVLNGLDADLKTKAFNMLQSLESEYDSILLIDHFPEFKNLFTNQYLVSKENGYSVVQHE